jgi:hypothetical protein
LLRRDNRMDLFAVNQHRPRPNPSLAYDPARNKGPQPQLPLPSV